jgi:hypothetical protein
LLTGCQFDGSRSGGARLAVALTLKVAVPDTYPDVEPEVRPHIAMVDETRCGADGRQRVWEQIEILLNKGLSDTQRKEIRQLLDEQVQENLGMAMMYTLCEAVREYLVENNRQGNVSLSRLANASFVYHRLTIRLAVAVNQQDGSEHHEMLRRLEMKKKKQEQHEATTLEQVRIAVASPIRNQAAHEWNVSRRKLIRSRSARSMVREAVFNMGGTRVAHVALDWMLTSRALLLWNCRHAGHDRQLRRVEGHVRGGDARHGEGDSQGRGHGQAHRCCAPAATQLRI